MAHSVREFVVTITLLCILGGVGGIIVTGIAALIVLAFHLFTDNINTLLRRTPSSWNLCALLTKKELSDITKEVDGDAGISGLTHGERAKKHSNTVGLAIDSIAAGGDGSNESGFSDSTDRLTMSDMSGEGVEENEPEQTSEHATMTRLMEVLKDGAWSRQILCTRGSWNGTPFMPWPGGAAGGGSGSDDLPRMTARIYTLMPCYYGGDTGWHCHPVTNVAYVLEGEVVTHLRNGRSKIFSKGEAFCDVVSLSHKGSNPISTFSKVLVWYIGSSEKR